LYKLSVDNISQRPPALLPVILITENVGLQV